MGGKDGWDRGLRWGENGRQLYLNNNKKKELVIYFLLIMEELEMTEAL